MDAMMSGIRRAVLMLAAGSVLWAQPAPPAPAQAPKPPKAVTAPPAKVGVYALSASRSYLGVGVREIDAKRAQELQLKEERGVEITSVDDDGPAAKAGLKVGDVVLEYNGQRVEGTEQFVRLVRETPEGRTAKLLVNRGGSAQTVSAAIGTRKLRALTGFGPDKYELERLVQESKRMGEEARRLGQEQVRLREFLIDTPRAYMSWRTGRLGIEGESLDSQLAEYFGVKSGVLVRSVSKGTPAEKAGMKAGDVILQVDETKVTAPREITSALRSLGSKRTFPVKIMREKKEMTLNVTVEDESQGRTLPQVRSVRQQLYEF